MELIHVDKDIVVCIKPARVLSTDEPGGLPELVREALGDPQADVRTVHRLDRVVSGLMVLARNPGAASELSRQIREDAFQKEYVAVVHGTPEYDVGKFWDLLLRDKARKMTFVAAEAGKGVQPASLSYRVLRKKRPGQLPSPTLVFQALRIEVNGELRQLETALGAAQNMLRSGGRLAVISFHSLEDRIVKNFLRDAAQNCICPPGLPVCCCGHKPLLTLPLRSKVITASKEELKSNPRSGCAKLRIAEKL